MKVEFNNELAPEETQMDLIIKHDNAFKLVVKLHGLRGLGVLQAAHDAPVQLDLLLALPRLLFAFLVLTNFL